MIKRKVRAGHQYPSWYGVAWFDLKTMEAVCYPIPLNIICRWLRDIYLLLARGPSMQKISWTCLEEMRQRSYDAGYSDALKRIAARLKMGTRETE